MSFKDLALARLQKVKPQFLVPVGCVGWLLVPTQFRKVSTKPVSLPDLPLVKVAASLDQVDFRLEAHH